MLVMAHDVVVVAIELLCVAAVAGLSTVAALHRFSRPCPDEGPLLARLDRLQQEAKALREAVELLHMGVPRVERARSVPLGQCRTTKTP